jgi:hypothetical protein
MKSAAPPEKKTRLNFSQTSPLSVVVLLRSPPSSRDSNPSLAVPFPKSSPRQSKDASVFLCSPIPNP